jgi:omega-6 fatty acid desaturase (delta-12 desaturase)
MLEATSSGSIRVVPPLPPIVAPAPAVRTDREVLDATRAFAVEDTGRSVRAVATTFGLLAAAIGAACFLSVWPLRVLASVIAGLLIVRAFILFHDHLHGALLRRSRVARTLFYAFGLLILSPPRVWRETHNYHHANNAKIVGSNVGSYAMVTVAMWRRMSWRERLVYRAIRHPLTILFGYVTIFLYGMCIAPFLRAPRKNAEALAAVVLHAALALGIATAFGPAMLLFALVLPMFVATASGAYLFYAQHNFPDVYVQPRESWSYVRAALESSSYMRMGRVMAFFTGNIGYHHVHHLNPMIPFYCLPDAMAAIPELAHPRETSLAPRDVAACFRLKLWDTEARRMVPCPG